MNKELVSAVIISAAQDRPLALYRLDPDNRILRGSNAPGVRAWLGIHGASRDVDTCRHVANAAILILEVSPKSRRVEEQCWQACREK